MVWLIKSKMLTKNCHSQTEPSIVQQLQILKYLIEIWPKSQETLWPPAQNIQNIPTNIWPPPVPISRNNQSRKQWSQIEPWLAGEKFEQPPLLKGSLNDVKRCSLTALSLSLRLWCRSISGSTNAVKSIWETTKLAKCAVNGFSSLSFVSQANLSSADKKKLLQQICLQQNLIPKWILTRRCYPFVPFAKFDIVV